MVGSWASEPQDTDPPKVVGLVMLAGTITGDLDLRGRTDLKGLAILGSEDTIVVSVFG